VSGRIVTASQEPAVGAWVYAFLGGSLHIVDKVATDGKGYYSFKFKKALIVDIWYQPAEEHAGAASGEIPSELRGRYEYAAQLLVVNDNMKLGTVIVGHDGTGQ
jgi:hypothetical protein